MESTCCTSGTPCANSPHLATDELLFKLPEHVTYLDIEFTFADRYYYAECKHLTCQSVHIFVQHAVNDAYCRGRGINGLRYVLTFDDMTSHLSTCFFMATNRAWEPSDELCRRLLEEWLAPRG